jgi:hypothetical protein
MASTAKRTTRAVEGLLLEANWKEHTAEIYPDSGPVVKIVFPEELSDAVQEAARRRVRVTGTVRRPRNGARRLEIEQLQDLGRPSPLAGLLAPAGPPAPKRDPFEGAKPIENVEEFFGELPDERSAEEIIADIESCRATHYPPYDDEEDDDE